MMSATVRVNPTASDVAALLPKYDNPDSDIRFMTLVDLCNILVAGSPTFLLKDYVICVKTIDCLLKLLDDTNGDVQSQALKCIGPLAAKAPPDILPPLIDKLTGIQTTKSQDVSIPSTATKALLISFPRPIVGIPPSKPVQDAYSAVSKVLIPRLLGYVLIPRAVKGLPDPPKGMLEINPAKGADIDAIDLLNQVTICFGPMMHTVEVQALQKKLIEILEDSKTSNIAKKKSVAGVALLASYFSDQLLGDFVSGTIESFRQPHLNAEKRRLLINMVGTVAIAIPQRFGPHLKSIAPFVLAALSQAEFDAAREDSDEAGSVDQAIEEVREAALITLNEFLSACVNEMRIFTDESLSACIRYLGYDPTVIDSNDDNMDEAFEADDELDLEDEDFEEEGNVSDEDDSSWKIRRCAAKAIRTFISTRSPDLIDSGVMYDRVAPVLIKGFEEREENVKLEILAALALLIRKTEESIISDQYNSVFSDSQYLTPSVKSRKRRRGGSDASMFDHPSDLKGIMSPGHTPSPTTEPKAELARLGPWIVQGVMKILGQKSVSTKQAGIHLLREFVHVRHGGLTEQLGNIVGPVMEIVQASSTGADGGAIVITAGGAASATGNSLRMESLQFLSVICDMHSSRAIIPHLDKIVPGLITAIEDKYFKVSCEALITSESVIKALTPPRAHGSEESIKSYIEELLKTVLSKAKANNIDLEVRQRAIHALAICISRSSNTQKLALPNLRQEALEVIEDRLRNETTRLSSIQAIAAVTLPIREKNDLKPKWVQSVALELANQLRKSDQRIRGSSLETLKIIALNQATVDALDSKSMKLIASLLLPLMNSNNLNHLVLAIDIMAGFIRKAPKDVSSEDFNNVLCQIVVSTVGTHSLEAFLGLVEVIGAQGVGASLMRDFLQKVGVSGDPAVVGLAIGTLLVFGQPNVGVSINDILKELKTAQDDQRRCLALTILGQSAFRLRASSPISPSVFLDFFNSRSDQVSRAAAVALGRAGAGNISQYVPIILSAFQSGTPQFLLLQSLRELLQQAVMSRQVLSRYSGEMWTNTFKISESDENKTIGAECIGRIACLEPKKYLPVLYEYLSNQKPILRGVVIQAVRFALSEPDEGFDEVLRSILVKMLVAMLGDQELENSRLALTTLNSAIRNKPLLILPHLSQLLPFVVKASQIDTSLVREVQMGPFKHKVDDGLEIRKSAYETLHALMDAAYARIDHSEFFDRVVEGLRDEHEIKILCGLMLSKLIDIDPDEIQRRLDSIAENFQTTLSTKLKDNAVKQEVEKAQEASKDVLRSTVRLQARFPGVGSASGNNVQGQAWKGYLEWVNAEYKDQLRMAEVEFKGQS